MVGDLIRSNNASIAKCLKIDDNRISLNGFSALKDSLVQNKVWRS